MKKFFSKIKEVGIKNTVIGSIKMLHYIALRHKYQYLYWNVSPFELRKYIQDVADYINSRNPECVIDCGCGLGELLRNVRASKRIGIDRGDGEILAARHLDKSGGIEFEKGTLENDDLIGIRADFLVTLGFTHGNSEEYWRQAYQGFLNRNDVKRIVVDVFPPVKGQYSLNFKNILPKSYGLSDRLGPYKGEKYVEVYEREDSICPEYQ